MNEEELLEELRAQRDLLQKHLEWLDGKIAALGGAASNNGPRAIKGPDEEPGNPAAPAAPTPKHPDKKALDAQHDPAIDREFGRFEASTNHSLLRAKTGCLALFALGTLLFLFLLFGLPYLLHSQ